MGDRAENISAHRRLSTYIMQSHADRLASWQTGWHREKAAQSRQARDTLTRRGGAVKAQTAQTTPEVTARISAVRNQAGQWENVFTI